MFSSTFPLIFCTPFNYPKCLVSSQEDSDYEPSLRSLLTSDEYFSTSEEEEGGESLKKPRVVNQTDSYGTLRLNRKTVPEQLKRKKLKKGEFAALQRGKVMSNDSSLERQKRCCIVVNHSQPLYARR